MFWKLTFAFFIIFPSLTTGDSVPLIKIQQKIGANSFDFSQSNNHPKKSIPTAVPFWVTNKRNDTVDTNTLKSSDWYASVVKNIEEREYEITRNGKTDMYSAPNRQQQLKASFNYNNFSLQPQNDSQAWKLRLHYSGIFAEKKRLTLPGDKVLPVIDSNRIIFSNDNVATEYINSKEGIRQNFIIQKNPVAKCAKIRVQLSVNKGWYLNKVHDRELHFAKWEGDQLSKKITYNSLKAWDATNKELSAKFVVNENHSAFEIEVNTTDAVYPVTIDPLSTNPSTTLNGINSNDYFGISVASAGDVNGDGYSDVIIGASGVSSFTGAAYLFQGSATGLSNTASMTLNGFNSGDFFGCSVGSAGDVNGDGYSDVIIGAYGTPSGTGKGAAYIYIGSSSGISNSPATILSGLNNNDFFGYNVASAGDVNGDGFSDVIVGAYRVSSLKGAAYLYLGSASGLSSTSSTTLNGITAGDQFGLSISCAGDVNGDGFSDVIVGAPGVSSNKGSAYLFLGSISGLSASPSIILNDINGITNDEFGYCVKSAGDVNGDGYSDVIVGAYGVSSIKGAAYLFLGSNTGLSTSPATTLSGISASDQFGISVFCAGDINGDGYSDIIVGAPGVFASKGAAYLFLGSPAGLSSSISATMSDINDVSNDDFGYSIASAGDINGDGYSDVIIGANGASSNAGAAYTYNGSAAGLANSPATTLNDINNVAGDFFGLSVKCAGDVNGDGYSDVIVAARGVSSVRGAAYLYLGSATGLSSTPATTLTDINNVANDFFGNSIGCAGDVNGDGYSDVIIGASGVSSNKGAAYIFLGGPGGLSSTPATTLNDPNNLTSDFFGNAVAGIGDVNGDGYSDVIVGAFGVSSATGAAYIYLGSASGLSSTPATTMNGVSTGDNFGLHVAGAGDVNSDGYDDVIVSAISVSSSRGAVYLYLGSSGGVPSAPATTINDINNVANDFFGVSLAGAGDVNGDGYADVIIGATGVSSGKGAAYLFLGSAGGLSSTPTTTLNDINGVNNDSFGSVANAGDVNGDGYNDVLIGAVGVSSTKGAAYLYLGSAAGLASSPTTTLTDVNNVANDQFGRVGCAGDVNGDGYSDVIVGANGVSSARGAAYLYYGDSTGGNRNNLRMYNADLTTPVNSSNFIFGNFGAGLFAKSFLGRSKGKLVWETRLSYNPYSGVPISNSTLFTAQQNAYSDLGITGTESKALITKLLGSSKYTKLRARIKYDPVTAITGQVYGPWRNASAVIDGNNLGILPVEIISFEAAWIKKEKTAQINFTTDKENGICCFEIEKSLDGFNFSGIGTIPAKNGTGVQSYNFIDDNAINKNQFYRLKIKGTAGQIEYSNIRQLQYSSSSEILVFPNPTSDVLQLILNNTFNKINVQIVNEAGQIVKQFTNIAVAGQTLTVPVSTLPAGNYWLRLQSGSEKQVLEFIKQ